MPKRNKPRQHTKEEAVEMAKVLIAFSNQVTGNPPMFDGFVIADKVMNIVEQGKEKYAKGDFHNAHGEFAGAMKLLTANAAWYFKHFVEEFEGKLDDVNSRLLLDYKDLRNRGANVLTELKKLATETEHKVRSGEQLDLDFMALSDAHWSAKQMLNEIKAEAQRRIANAEAEKAEAERAERERLAAEERAAELERERIAAQKREEEIEGIFAGSALAPTKEEAAA